MTPHGFKDRTTDEATVCDWWGRWPAAMPAIVPGDFGAVALDVDSAESVAEADALGIVSVKTFETRTPGGRHIYFRATGLPPGHSVKLGAIVCRFDRGYVIAPGAVRADGGVYRPCGRFADMATLPARVTSAYLAAVEARLATSAAPPPPLEHGTTTEPCESVIAAFNREYPVPAMLARYGYSQHGDRFRRPGATSVPGVILLEDGRAFSHHAGDVLANGHGHDAFSIFCRHEHAGDVARAVRAAAAALGMDRPRVTPIPPRGRANLRRLVEERRTA